eukprot:CAMPEP_0168512034 /NCGR_PEP_ID=MMETSP0405-20121227/2519_1 /TAXON_ID=498012 /ORGANISM="Trichosphaerium sp, Strain Am-I-7 wt" /LENGTH=180 /DNA_ID=CAMNT_0008530383 /DNA_START=1086 /DNA_END=1628 /DNA_ORIENTATION=+
MASNKRKRLTDFDAAEELRNSSTPLKKTRRHEQRRRTFPEKCTICLGEMTMRGATDVCEHNYCYLCIIQWSKVTNKCPMCSRRFTSITKLAYGNNGHLRKGNKVFVDSKEANYQPRSHHFHSGGRHNTEPVEIEERTFVVENYDIEYNYKVDPLDKLERSLKRRLAKAKRRGKLENEEYY